MIAVSRESLICVSRSEQKRYDVDLESRKQSCRKRLFEDTHADLNGDGNKQRYSLTSIEPSHEDRIFDVPKLPRVLHKSSRLCNPLKTVYPNCEDVTGLNNFMLEYLLPFDVKYCNSVMELLRLPKPVCLIAHSGFDFDSQIIVAEFIKATETNFDFGDILCADSLMILRTLDKIEFHEKLQKFSPSLDTDGDDRDVIENAGNRANQNTYRTPDQRIVLQDTKAPVERLELHTNGHCVNDHVVENAKKSANQNIYIELHSGELFRKIANAINSVQTFSLRMVFGS